MSQMILKSKATPVRKKNNRVLLAVPESDCHVVACKLLELFMKQAGFEVLNLGATTSSREIVDTSAEFKPAAVFISCQNGHAFEDLKTLREELNAKQIETPIFIGGKIAVGAEASLTSAKESFKKIGIRVLDTFEQAASIAKQISARPTVTELAL
jgi:methylaspartate mutase sigma subunit